MLLSLHLGRYAYFQCLRSAYRASCRTAEEGLQLALEGGLAYYYLICQCYRARALLHLGEWGEMLRVLREALQMAERNGHHLWTMHLLLLAWLYEQAGAFEPARQLCEQTLKQAREIQYGYGLRLGLILLGLAHLGLAQYEHAFRCFSEVADRGESEHSRLDWILHMQLCHGLSAYWLAQQEFGRARQEAARLCELALQPGERTYLALGRRTLAEVALAERDWEQAEGELGRALAVLEGGEAPLAAWQVYATAAQLHQHRGRRTEADHYWLQSAAVLRQLADSLGDAGELRQWLLTHPLVPAILRHARRAGSRSSPAGATAQPAWL